LHVKAGASGIGIFAQSDHTGIHAEAETIAVSGLSYSGHGIVGDSQTGTGVWGTSGDGNGVRGWSASASGLHGFSNTGFGLFATSSTNYAGYFQGNLYVTGTVTQNSDERLKQGVTNLGYGLSEVLALRPVTWTWRNEPDQGRQMGLIAQEVETLLPELVATTKDADQMKGLNYVGLVPVVIKAIQEQHAITERDQLQIKQQQREIDGLKALVCLDHPDATVCK
jgi:hypothetical protein